LISVDKVSDVAPGASVAEEKKLEVLRLLAPKAAHMSKSEIEKELNVPQIGRHNTITML